MPTAILKRSVKLGGVRYEPGTALEVSDADMRTLTRQGLVTAPPPPPSQPKAKIPRTPEEKRQALLEATQRVASATGQTVKLPGPEKT